MHEGGIHSGDMPNIYAGVDGLHVLMSSLMAYHLRAMPIIRCSTTMVPRSSYPIVTEKALAGDRVACGVINAPLIATEPRIGSKRQLDEEQRNRTMTTDAPARLEPVSQPESDRYWEGARNGELWLQRDKATGSTSSTRAPSAWQRRVVRLSG